MNNHNFKSIGIIGIGLIGGSFAKAFYDKNIVVYGLDTNVNTLAKAADSYVFEGLTNNLNDFLDFPLDLIYICLPVKSTIEVLKSIAEKGVKTPITDAASTKRSICESAKSLKLNFVGGHPIAGKEVSGFLNSEKEMLNGAYHILIESENKQLQEALKILHLDIGMKIGIMDEKTHDKVFGLISHFPHLIAFALIDFVESENIEALSFTGGGFKDFTRIAKSDPVMWTHIFFDNKDILLQYIDKYIDELLKWKSAINEENLDIMKEMISNVKALREAL
jgi:prephenate dehydrogenase